MPVSKEIYNDTREFIKNLSSKEIDDIIIETDDLTPELTVELQDMALLKRIETIRSHGFNIIAWADPIFFEEAFIFNTKTEARKAYMFFEKDTDNYAKYEICGWWYGIQEFKDKVLPDYPDAIINYVKQ